MSAKPISMMEITFKDYKKFITTHKEIVIEDRIGKKIEKIKIGLPTISKPSSQKTWY